jgi:hypothetical protein
MWVHRRAPTDKIEFQIVITWFYKHANANNTCTFQNVCVISNINVFLVISQ